MQYINLERSQDIVNYDKLVIPKQNKFQYNNLHKIGEGTFGKVYRAKNSKNQYVALKQIKHKRTKDFVNRIKKEIKILTILNQENVPSIIKLYDYFELDTNNSNSKNEYYIVFEYIDPLPFYTILHKLTLNNIKMYMRQLLLALAHCHKNGIVHADVKPGNLLLIGKQLKLIDYGHSFFYFPQHKNTHYLGTTSYKAPEILMNWQYFNYKVDIWSAGRIFLDMLVPHKLGSFRGQDNDDQVIKLAQVFGSKRLTLLSHKYNLPLFELKDYPEILLQNFILHSKTKIDIIYRNNFNGSLNLNCGKFTRNYSWGTGCEYKNNIEIFFKNGESIFINKIFSKIQNETIKLTFFKNKKKN